MVVFDLSDIIHDKPSPNMEISIVDTFQHYSNYRKSHKNTCDFNFVVLQLFDLWVQGWNYNYDIYVNNIFAYVNTFYVHIFMIMSWNNHHHRSLHSFIQSGETFFSPLFIFCQIVSFFQQANKTEIGHIWLKMIIRLRPQGTLHNEKFGQIFSANYESLIAVFFLQ